MIRAGIMYMKKSHDYKFLIKYVRYKLREKQKFILLLILPKVFETNMNAQAVGSDSFC